MLPKEPSALPLANDGVTLAVRRAIRSAGAIVSVFALVPIVAYALNGVFVRRVADDFCNAANIRVYGWLGAQVHQYLYWTGRYTSTAAMTLAASNPSTVYLLPPVLIVLAVVSVVLVAYKALHAAGWLLSPSIACALGMVLVGVTVRLSWSPFESVYWQTGSLTYLAPLIGGGFLAAWLIDRPSNRHTIPIAFIAAFVNGGFSDAFVVLQTAALLAATVWWRRTVLASATLGSVISTLMIVLAPGNAYRQAYYPRPAPIGHILFEASRATWFFVTHVVGGNKATVFMVLATAALLAYVGKAPTWRLGSIALFLAAAAALTWAVSPAPIWATSQAPVTRVMILALVPLLAGIAALGTYLGSVVRTGLSAAGFDLDSPVRITGQPATVMSVAILCVIVLRFSIQIINEEYRLWPSLVAYAQTADRQLHEIQRGDTNPVAVSDVSSLGPLAHSQVMEIGPDPQNWVNGCAATAYGLPSVAVTLQQ